MRTGRNSLSGLFLASLLGTSTSHIGVLAAASPEKIIIDTDIGSDIDDAFAVALALQTPQVHILGISTVSGDTSARAKILDQMLGVSGHGDIPVAAGSPTPLQSSTGTTSSSAFWIGRQSRFGEKGAFAKATHPTAVAFILEQIRRFPGEITLVTIGPLTNVGALIDSDPQTFRRLKRVVMMGGSMRSGYALPGEPTNGPSAEYNIAADIPASKKLFHSGVPIYVMPTDSTWQLKLDEVKRDALLTQGTPITNSLGLLYLMWGFETPILWDAMAVGYVVKPELCPVEPMHIVIDDKGFTRAEPGQPNAQVCLHSDTESFFHFYLSRF